MTNHIHLILVPSTEKGLYQALRPLHMRCAQHLNKQRGWKGHVWQGRYFSSPLDEHYTWAAIRYVERNPVRANMVRIAEKYTWSSAAGHCELKADSLITSAGHWQAKFKAIGDWSAWLAERNSSEELKTLRGNVEKGLPCGSSPFINKLEKLIGRPLASRATKKGGTKCAIKG